MIKIIILCLILASAQSFASTLKCTDSAIIVAAKIAEDEPFEFMGTHELKIAEKNPQENKEYFEFLDGIGGLIGIEMTIENDQCLLSKTFKGQTNDE